MHKPNGAGRFAEAGVALEAEAFVADVAAWHHEALEASSRGGATRAAWWTGCTHPHALSIVHGQHRLRLVETGLTQLKGGEEAYRAGFLASALMHEAKRHKQHNPHRWIKVKNLPVFITFEVLRLQVVRGYERV